MEQLDVTVGSEGRLRLLLAEGRVVLTIVQVQVLYALAESDWGRLSYSVLAKRVEDRGSPVSKAKLNASLEALRQRRLVRDYAPADPSLGPAIALTGPGLETITNLTRAWPGWAAYWQSLGLTHY